jgi:vacuolar-type H+-ATPase subunit E/Vma4
MSLFDDIARTLGVRKAYQNSEIAGLRASLNETSSQMRDFGERLEKVEKAVEQFVSAFEEKLDDLAARGRDANRQTAVELASLHRDLDTYIELLEKAIEAQFDMARRIEIRRLLTTARTKRTRIGNIISRKAANDG